MSKNNTELIHKNNDPKIIINAEKLIINTEKINKLNISDFDKDILNTAFMGLVATNNLLLKERNELVNSNKILKDKYDIIEKNNNVLIYKNNELEQQIKYLLKENDNLKNEIKKLKSAINKMEKDNTDEINKLKFVINKMKEDNNEEINRKEYKRITIGIQDINRNDQLENKLISQKQLLNEFRNKRNDSFHFLPDLIRQHKYDKFNDIQKIEYKLQYNKIINKIQNMPVSILNIFELKHKGLIPLLRTHLKEKEINKKSITDEMNNNINTSWKYLIY